MTNRGRNQFVALLGRFNQSAVVWSWAFNGLRLASGFLLLPLVLTKLSQADLGMYYVLLSLSALVPLVDFGFAPTIGRFVSYAMGGAQSIQAHGVARPGNASSPNYPLLWELLFTTRVLYRFLTLALLLVLGTWGTYVVELRINETGSPFVTRLAWVATLLTATLDIYANWWVTYLRSMNEVLSAVRIGVFGWILRLIIAAILLVCGGGLLSLPVGSFFGSLVQRFLARHRVHALLDGHPAPARSAVRKYLAVFWPNTWRLGLQFISGYLTVNANTALCLYWFGLNANAQYGLSVQLLGFILGMSSVWITVKWPLIGQCRARHDFFEVQRIMWPRVWAQSLTFIVGCLGVLLFMPMALHFLGGGKQILPLKWMALLMLNGFFDMQFTIWGTLLSTENRLPYLWPAVATNVLSLILSLTLLHVTSLGLGALVLAPLTAGLLFNHWYWPPYAARSLGTTLLRFLIHGPSESATANESEALDPKAPESEGSAAPLC